MSNRRIPGVFRPVLLLFMGLAVLVNFASKPGFETIRAVDVIRLIAAGMCFGVALVMLFTFFGGNRSH
jgi:hypothetical protein